MVAVRKRAEGKGRVGGARSYVGSTATAGNSRAIRFETAFYKAAPEFYPVGSAIRADIIGPGTILVRVDGSQHDPEQADPVIAAWLSFIDAGIHANPGHLSTFDEAELTALETLVAGVVVDDEDVLPDDVTF